MYGIIYKSTGPTGLVYIGQTTNTLKRRKSAHAFRAKKKDRRGAFQIALLDLGFSNFTWEEIEACETKEELDAREKYWIEKLKANDPAHGYNGTVGGTKTVYTAEVRRKMSEAAKKARAAIPEEIQRRMVEKHREAMKGRTLTEAHKKKIGAANRGKKKKPRTPEHRRKIGEGVKLHYQLKREGENQLL